MRPSLSIPSLNLQGNALTWATLIWGLLCLAVFTRAYLSPTKNTVFHDYRDAGRAWLDGGDVYSLDRGDGQGIRSMSGFRYAPVVSVVLVPFSVFPNDLGGVLWRLASVCCFLAAFAWYLRDALPRSDQRTDTDHAIMWLLLIPLSLASINNGQANVLLMALLLGAGVAVVKERWNLAAALLAGAFLMKLYPLAVALLMILIHPRALGWRFLIAVAIGLAIPFAFQSPSYVWHQYDNWLTLVGSDNRREFPLTQGYRDFYLLTRLTGMPLAPTAYLLVQLSAAGLVAAVGVLGCWRAWPAKDLVTRLLTLGCAWMAVFGPSIESCSFILIAPALAWALADAWKPTTSSWSRHTLILVFGMFLVVYVTSWFRESRDWFYFLQPLAALLFFVERWLHALTNDPFTAAAPHALTSN